MLWLVQEDVNQQDQMLYFGLRSEDLNAPLSPWPHLSEAEVRYRLLPPDFPPRRFSLDGSMLPDFWRTQKRDFVVSAALLDAMRLPPGAAQVLPILLECPNPDAHAKGYVLLRVLAQAPALDRRRSEVETIWSTRWLTGERFSFEHVKRYVIDPATVAPADLFRATEAFETLIATDALAARVLAGGYQGMAFGNASDLDVWGHPRSRRTAGGGLVAYGQEPFGVMPARGSAQRPPFTPDPALPEALRPIEAAVQHRLPEHYVRFLLDPPTGLLRRSVMNRLLFTDPQHVAEENRGVRAATDGQFFRGRHHPWPADWLVVGWDWNGDRFAMDLGVASPPVLLWDHEMGVTTVRSPSLDAYAAKVAADIAAYARDNEDDEDDE